MKQILPIVFVILLAGCNSTDKLSKAENLPIITKSHATINHLVIDSGKEVANTSTVDVKQTDEISETITDVSTNAKSSLEDIGQKLHEHNNEIIKVWNDSYTPIYDSYLYNHYDEDAFLKSISDLKTAYKDLQDDINNVILPTDISVDENTKIEEIKEDLIYAISNRQLAIIELQSMMSKNDVSQVELLEVHISNSNRYLEHASALCDELNLGKDALVTSR